MLSMRTRYEKAFTEHRYWNKLNRYAKGAGRQVTEKALWLFYALKSNDTPAWAKRVIYGALGYLIFPLDAVPDFIPAMGLTDDLSVITAALATVAFTLTDSVKAQAADKLSVWFDDEPASTRAPVTPV